MRLMQILGCAVVLLSVAAAVTAQSGGQQSLAGTLGIYVFPANGQDAEQQSKDEAACYQWAVTNSGTDPFEAQKQQAASAQQAQAEEQQAALAGAGAGARGAVGGAAAGALIGEIGSGNAGRGAAYGAAIGLIAGRRHARMQEQGAQQQAQAQAAQTQQASQAQIDGFKKAFSACMEGKKYVAKI